MQQAHAVCVPYANQQGGAQLQQPDGARRSLRQDGAVYAVRLTEYPGSEVESAYLQLRLPKVGSGCELPRASR